MEQLRVQEMSANNYTIPDWVDRDPAAMKMWQHNRNWAYDVVYCEALPDGIQKFERQSELLAQAWLHYGEEYRSRRNIFQLIWWYLTGH